MPAPLRYRFDLVQLITSLLPSLLRKPTLLAWLQALLQPAAALQHLFEVYAAATRTELSYNGQTMLLEKALNDRFDAVFRRIKIINADTFLQPVYLNFVAEQQPVLPLYFVAEGQPGQYFEYWAGYVNQIGFTVQLPRSLRGAEAAVQARIGQLKLATIKHKLLYI
jgi:hypothetical protein